MLKRRLKQIGFGLGGLLLLFALFVAVEHIRGAWGLSRYTHLLAVNGEELSVAKLIPPHPPLGQNAYLDLVALTNQFEPILTNLADTPSQMSYATPGKVIVAYRLKQWIVDRITTNDWSKLESQMNRSRELLDLIHAAVRKPSYDSGFDYSVGFIDPKFGSYVTMREVARFLSAATLYELKDNQLESANRHLCDSVRLVADQRPEPLMICQLFRQACAGIAFESTWQALQAPGWNDAQLAELQSEWENIDFLKDMDVAMEMERALTMDCYEQIRNSHAKYSSVMDQYGDAPWDRESPARGFIYKYVLPPMWRAAWADQDELRMLRKWQPVIGRQRLARTNSWIATRSSDKEKEGIWPWAFLIKDDMTWYDHARFLFSSESFLGGDIVIRRTIESQVEQQMAVTAIAISRYRLQTGALPADLAALVPKYLPVLPMDNMDGKPLRYRLLPARGFALYSVGEDGIDGQGDSAWTHNGEQHGLWGGKDAVWPAPATDEEAIAAMNRPEKY